MKLLDILLILFLVCCCLLKKEGFGMSGQLMIPQLQNNIIQPATTSYYKTSSCEDDKNWTKGDLKCGDYIIEDNDCEDIGDDGKTANEACKMTCDNCKPDVQLKRTGNKMLKRFPDKRIPSPISSLEEFVFSDYGEFDGMMGSGSDVGMNAELYAKIEDLTTIIKELKESSENMESMIDGSNAYNKCPDTDCIFLKDNLLPSECNSRIGKTFTFGEVFDNDKHLYPLKCGTTNVTIGDYGQIFYDCENNKWVSTEDNGVNYTDYLFQTDFTCNSSTGRISADCVQEWGPCKMIDGGVCGQTFDSKEPAINEGSQCIEEHTRTHKCQIINGECQNLF